MEKGLVKEQLIRENEQALLLPCDEGQHQHQLPSAMLAVCAFHGI
jgi:hypothetical protein